MSSQTPPEEYSEVSNAIRSGEYFREASSVYDAVVHEAMAERYFYLFITAISGLIMLITFSAMDELYPLERSVPFIVNSDNLANDLPAMRSLLAQKGADPDEALVNFMVAHYVKNREEYEIEEFDKNINGVKTQSTPEVYAEYQALIDRSNPKSPITLFQRHSIKRIRIVNTQYYTQGDTKSMEVLYEATVKSKNSIKKSRWQANISFIYSGIELNEGGEGIKPVTFIVTNYENKRLQDIQ